jgi:hypothetical protein
MSNITDFIDEIRRNKDLTFYINIDQQPEILSC